MTAPFVLTGDDVRRLLDPTALRRALADGFASLSRGAVDVPPRIGVKAPSGLLGAMPGYVPGVGLVAKLVTIFPRNHGGPLPSHQGLVALFDEHDGRPIAAMDAAAVTELRTAAAAALATDVLARAEASVLTIVGAGIQARGHLQAFRDLRRWSEIRIVNRTRSHAERLAGQDDRAIVVGDLAAALGGADVVALCTDATEPEVELEWLGSGTHVSSVGSGRELASDVVAAARIAVEWRGAALSPPPAGAIELQGLDGEAVVELGEILTAARPGRQSPDEITVYKSTGHAVEDAVAARLVADAARRAAAVPA